MFFRDGHPMPLKTENGTKPFSVEMEDYLGSKGIHPAKSATYWRRSYREKERYNRTLLKSIGAIHAKNKDWQPYLTQCFSIIVQQNMLQYKPHVLCFFLIIRHHFQLLNKPKNLSHQEKEKKNTPTLK